jgi:hypothetical protein
MTNCRDALQCYEPGTMAVKQLFPKPDDTSGAMLNWHLGLVGRIDCHYTVTVANLSGAYDRMCPPRLRAGPHNGVEGPSTDVRREV